MALQTMFFIDLDGNIEIGCRPTRLTEGRESWHGKPAQLSLDDRERDQENMQAWQSDDYLEEL